jgi:hypothetical protein
MFRTQTGQTGRDAYVYELAAIRNEYRELSQRLTTLAATISEELPSDATGQQSIASDRFPNATMPCDAETYRRQLPLMTTLNGHTLEQFAELLDSLDEFQPVEPIVRTAQDFHAAAELLTEVEAPSEYEVEALASAQDDLRSEADYLANVDPSEIGSPAVVGRYLSTSRASRRHAVIRYMTTARMGNPSPQLRRVLDIIGGEGF